MAWETLLGIIDEARHIDAEEASQPPEACPIDYTALTGGENGTLFCPWCGWKYPHDA
jgi:hypothetical protein